MSTTQPPTKSSRPQRSEIDVAGLTHQGHVREENEDHFLVASMQRSLQAEQTSLPPEQLDALTRQTRDYLFLVADGVGGQAGGERASGTALRWVARYVADATRCYYQVAPSDDERLTAELREAVMRAHAVLQEEEAGTATTLTMVFVAWPRAWLVHVGDSRCYRLRDGTLERLTTDQTIAQSLVDAGVMTAADADRTPWRNVLASALGGSEATPATFTTDCEWEDVMLLCTDGLTKHVSDDEIAAALAAARPAAETCRVLVELALERGGTDNVTVVVGRLQAQGDATMPGGPGSGSSRGGSPGG